MKKNKNIVLRTVCNSPFLIAEGDECVEMNHLIFLNKTAAFLWEAMGEGEFTTDMLVDALTAKYKVSPEDAHRDVVSIINKMKEQGVIE